MSLQKGLVGHWTMDDRDTSGGILYDKSGYDIHMSVNNTSAISTVSANIGDGIYFSNSGSTATNVDSIPDNLGNKIKNSCSISFWAKDISFTGNDSFDAWVIRSSGDNIDKSIGVFGGREGETFTFERRDESGNFQGIGTTTTSWGSEWHHIVCQFSTSNNNREIWVDSELDNTQANDFQATSDFTGLDISLGGLDGELDDLRLYSRTLSESEINALYQMRSMKETTSNIQVDQFANGNLNLWDVNEATISTERTRTKGYSAQLVNPVESDYHMRTTPFGNSFQPKTIWYWWQETTNDCGSGIRLRNSNGDFEVGATTNNAQWDIDDGNGFENNVNPSFPDYEEWVLFKLFFDWSTETFGVRFYQPSTGIEYTDAGRPLKHGVDIEYIELWDYSSGWGPGTCSGETWVDEIKVQQ